jgi:hypothetical protein
MPIDLTRETVARAIFEKRWPGRWNNHAFLHQQDQAYDEADAVLQALSEPTRLAQARAEGYREGVQAVAAALRREIPTGDGSTRSLTWSEALDDVDAIRALLPPPAEPANMTAKPADWTVADTELARDILSYLGIGSDASLEPGDRRRDRIAAMICADRERRIVKPAEPSAPVAEGEDIVHRHAQEYEWRADEGDYTPTEAEWALLEDFGNSLLSEIEDRDHARISALEAENAKLRERNAALEDGLRPFAKLGELFPPAVYPGGYDEGIYCPAAGPEYAIGGNDLRRARALLQGGPDAG